MKVLEFRLAASVALSAVGVGVLSAQDDVLRSWVLPTEAIDWGQTLSAIPDLDGDGVPEILWGDARYETQLGPDTGALFVLSGREVPAGDPAVVIRSHFGTSEDNYFGWKPVALGDMTGDGTEEYGAGGPYESPIIFDGRDGAILHPASWGWGVPLGDVNGDGLADVLIFDSLILGGSFSPLYSFVAPPHSLAFATAIGDLDGDGAQDFAAGGLSFHCEGAAPAIIYSGATGTEIHSFSTLDGCLQGMYAGGDPNVDGALDVLADWGRSIHQFDSRTGALLTQVPDLANEVLTYDDLVETRVGDLNGNGVDDLLIRRREYDRVRSEEYVLALEGSTNDVLLRIKLSSFYSPVSSDAIDWNGDGFPDFLVANGHVLELRSGAPARAATATEPRSGARVIPARCGAITEEARIGITGHPDLGTRPRIHLSGVPAGTSAVLLVGRLAPRRTPAQGCWAMIRPEERHPVTAVTVTPGRAVATTTIKIPDLIHLVGTSFYAQWVVGDRRRPRATSDVLELVIGMPLDTPSTVTGVVRFEDGLPAANAMVEALDQGLTAKTNSDGSFSIPNVAIRWDPVRLLVSTRVTRTAMSALSGPITPIPGRTTAVDDLVLSAEPRTLTFGTELGRYFSYTARYWLLQQGLKEENVIDTRELPQQLAPFTAIWQSAGAELELDACQRVIDYVTAGGGFHASGDQVNIVNALVGGGIQLAGQLGSRTHDFNPDAANGITQIPNELASLGLYLPPAILGVSGDNVLLRSPGGYAVGAVWSGADIVGGSGRLTWIPDYPFSNAYASPEVVANLQAFLARPRTAPNGVSLALRKQRALFEWIAIAWNVTAPGHGDIVALYDQDPNVAGPDGFLPEQWQWVARPSPWRSEVRWGPGFYAAYIHEDIGGTRTILHTAGPTGP